MKIDINDDHEIIKKLKQCDSNQWTNYEKLIVIRYKLNQQLKDIKKDLAFLYKQNSKINNKFNDQHLLKALERSKNQLLQNEKKIKNYKDKDWSQVFIWLSVVVFLVMWIKL